MNKFLCFLASIVAITSAVYAGDCIKKLQMLSESRPVDPELVKKAYHEVIALLPLEMIEKMVANNNPFVPPGEITSDQHAVFEGLEVIRQFDPEMNMMAELRSVREKMVKELKRAQQVSSRIRESGQNILDKYEGYTSVGQASLMSGSTRFLVMRSPQGKIELVDRATKKRVRDFAFG